MRGVTSAASHRGFQGLKLCLLLFVVGCLLEIPLCAETVEAWARRYNHFVGSTDSAVEVVGDGAGNYLVTGNANSEEGGWDIVTVKYSSAGTVLWSRRYNGPGNGSDLAYAIAVDNNGNAFVAGSSYGNGNDDCVTLGYSSDGVPLWTNLYVGTPNLDDEARDVALDANGNVYVAGYSYYSGTSRSEYLTIAYSSDGSLLWSKAYRGPDLGRDRASSIAVGPSANVFVTGSSPGIGSSYDYATIAYSNSGVALWTNRYNGTGNSNDEPVDMVVDDAGSPIVTGRSLPGTGGFDIVTIKYDSAGGVLWNRRFDGPPGKDDRPAAITLDGHGDVYITGVSSSNLGNSQYGTLKYSNNGQVLWTNYYFGNSENVGRDVVITDDDTVVVAGDSGPYSGPADYVIIGYSSGGAPLWTNSYDGAGGGDDWAAAAAVGTNGACVVTGNSWSGSSEDFGTVAYTSLGTLDWAASFNGGPGNADDTASAICLGSGGRVYVTGSSIGLAEKPDYSTICYSSAGSALWTNRFTGLQVGDDTASDAASDHNGNVIVTGGSSGDFATIKYSPIGTPIWTNWYTSPGNVLDKANAVAVDSSGNVYVAGESVLNSTFHFATVAYSEVGVPLWTNFYKGPGNGSHRALDVVVTGNGSVVVAGTSSGVGTLIDYAVVAYSGQGVPLWTNRYDGPAGNYDFLRGLATDDSGRVYLTGYSLGIGTSYDYATVAYSSNGIALWTKRYNGSGNGADQANAVVTGPNGNVYVVGGISHTSFDFHTIAYSSAGSQLWTARYNGPSNGVDAARAVTVGSNGVVYVTGVSRGSSDDYLTIAYTSGGTPLWTNRYDGPAGSVDDPESGRSIVVSPEGEVFVTGWSSAGSADDFATVKYVTLPPGVSGEQTVDSLQLDSPAAGMNTVNFTGIPRNQYVAQVALELAGPWQDLDTGIADTNGVWSTIDAGVTNESRFYRSVWR